LLVGERMTAWYEEVLYVAGVGHAGAIRRSFDRPASPAVAELDFSGSLDDVVRTLLMSALIQPR
jgi:hypothetical protein